MREKQSAQRNRVSYKVFLKVLLDFQLHGHEKFLQSFLERFRGEDGNGVVNEGEFRALVDSLEMGLEEAEVTRLLGLVDPFNNSKLPFRIMWLCCRLRAQGLKKRRCPFAATFSTTGLMLVSIHFDKYSKCLYQISPSKVQNCAIVANFTMLVLLFRLRGNAHLNDQQQ